MPITPRHQTTIVAGAALACVLLTSGCSSISDTLVGEKVDYRTTGTQSVKLDVPPDLSQLPGQIRYGQVQASTISASSLQRAGAKQADTAANPAVASTTQGGVKLERQGQNRWLSVNQTPEQVWPQVRAFWQDVGFELTVDKADVGIMETNWSENKAKVPQDGIIRQSLGRVFDMLYDTGERDMYRTRIERTANGTEIYISHRGMSEEYEDNRKERTTWRARPSDPGLEAEMLSRLMLKLGATKEAAAAVKQEKAPEVAAAPARQAVQLNAAGNALTLDVDADTAWRRVGLALDRSGFTVENRDRKQGTFDVRLSDNDPAAAKPGFFARMFSSEKAAENLQRYQVRVQAQGNRTSLISVLTSGGEQTTSAAAKRIARQLQDELN
ncbi:MAG: outer membrane protein assembly factor BamC [Aquabacterium sp.]|uniref:outer membrane protein assembly factor BamC n=1 Tax=Aquabacterium sp. TaxID=1872578 RepID=UPI003BDA222C